MRRERITRLEVKNITQNFGGAENLFNDISFDIPLGKIVVLEGGLGSGKSLLLRVIAGLFDTTKGDVIYNQKRLSDLSFEDSVPMRLSTAICFENGGLLMNKTLDENIKLPLLYHSQWRNERSLKLYE